MSRSRAEARTTRRRFLGAATAALTAPGVASSAGPRAGATPVAIQGSVAPAVIDIATLKAAQGVAAVGQTDEALGKALPLANRYRSHIESLRRVAVDTEIEPAFGFDPRRRRAPTPSVTAPASQRAALPRPPARVPGPSSETEIAFAPVTRLRAWLDAGHVSSAQLVALAIARLVKHDPTLSCVVTLADHRAASEAKAADSAKAARSETLRGIPYGAKDLFDSSGIRTLWGARPFLDRKTPQQDATAIARLASAGACLTAKLATGELAIGDAWAGEPQFQDGRPLSAKADGVRGRKTRNPWDPTTGASGSSAGPAAAVAAGLVPFALATETGGSIVSPASTCGVTGLRPTYGRVSRHGVMTLRWTMDKVGVIARSVADCGAVLNAIHGPDGNDRSVVATPFLWNAMAGGPIRKFRLGVVESELLQPDPSASDKEKARFALVRPVFEAALEVYRKAGFEIVPVSLPSFPANALYAIHNAEAGAMFDEITRSGAIDSLEGQGPNDRSSQLRASRFIPAVDYIRAQRIRTLMIEAVEELFEGVDVFLTSPSSDSVNMTNLTGHPALVLPAGFVKSETGIEMPQNIMLTGRLDDEATLLDAGFAFERETPWHAGRPPLYV